MMKASLEHNALLELIALENIVIQKADKGNVVVLVDKSVYLQKMKSILDDESKFRKLDISDNNIVQTLIETQDRIKSILGPLKAKKVISEEVYKKIMPIGSQPGRLYGLCKVHKESVDGHKPFRPILSAINTPSYQLAKFLIPMLEPITKNDFVTTDSFSFSNDIKSQNVNSFMVSYDVDSLFTNIPLNETIDICIDKLYTRRNTLVNGLNKQEFRSILELATKESLFLFDKSYYSQIDGVAMGSPLGPTLANIFLCHYEEIWLSSCPKQFKPTFYKRYVDDIFCLFKTEQNAKQFQKFLNSRHKSMNFTLEKEENACLPFLDVKVTKSDTFVTSLYKKPTFSGIYLNFKSHVPETYKKGLIFCLLFRLHSICSNWTLIHDEICKLKCILLKNKYPLEFINACIHTFLSKLFIEKIKPLTVPKKEFFMCLPFLGSETLAVKKRLKKLFSSQFPMFQLKIVLKSGRRIGSFLNFKDILPFGVHSLVVYKYKCSHCNMTYIGKTKRHHLVRMCEHLGISYKTRKNTKFNPDTTTAIRDHIRVNNHPGDFSNFKIISYANTDFEALIKESLLVGLQKPVLNKQVKGLKLELF